MVFLIGVFNVFKYYADKCRYMQERYFFNINKANDLNLHFLVSYSVVTLKTYGILMKKLSYYETMSGLFIIVQKM